MKVILRTMLVGVVDYAGLFPPAKLPLAEALAKYHEYVVSEDAWMLGKFICPAGRLGELDPFVQRFREDGRSFDLSVLGTGADTADVFVTNLAQDLAAIRAFLERHPGAGTASVYEVKLPGDVWRHGTPETMSVLADATAFAVEASGLSTLTPYFEGAWDEQWQPRMEAALDGLAVHNARRPSRRCQPAGFKIRCGGLEAAAFPSTEQLAATLYSACRTRVALKATAGLHHPIRRADPAIGATMHGFINLLVAATVAWARDADPATIQRALEESDASAFQLSEAGWKWSGLSCSGGEVNGAREELLKSFGSCSFDEPRDDLRSLGWW